MKDFENEKRQIINFHLTDNKLAVLNIPQNIREQDVEIILSAIKKIINQTLKS